MKTRTNNGLFIAINIIFTIAGIGILYLSSILWMGSKEDYEELLNKSYWSFFANRLFFSLLIGLVLVIAIGFFNWLFQKIAKTRKRIGKILLIEFLIFAACSLILTVFQLS